MPTDGKTAGERERRGEPLRLLFVCSRNQWRSPTAERVYASRLDVEARSAGLRASARRRLKYEDLEWADIVFAMEAGHAKQIRRDHPGALEESVLAVLDIPDDYRFMDPELVDIIRTTVDNWLATSGKARDSLG